ncbi:hypothetical protein ACIQU6_43930, partial [Streptomyces sp. NPDC090442]|uniref:hypothetical protein n=1 Tax=Streptomyces sp. NPDC090442 TaxID=3365962 RepID=UPI0038134F89
MRITLYSTTALSQLPCHAQIARWVMSSLSMLAVRARGHFPNEAAALKCRAVANAVLVKLGPLDVDRVVDLRPYLDSVPDPRSRR